jgi:hypothetical protein
MMSTEGAPDITPARVEADSVAGMPGPRRRAGTQPCAGRAELESQTNQQLFWTQSGAEPESDSGPGLRLTPRPTGY